MSRAKASASARGGSQMSLEQGWLKTLCLQPRALTACVTTKVPSYGGMYNVYGSRETIGDNQDE